MIEVEEVILSEKKINSKIKKYNSFLKKVQKDLSQAVKRLDTFMKKTNEILFQYPLNEHKNIILKVRSIKHLEIETTIKMMRFKERAVEKILEILTSRLPSPKELLETGEIEETNSCEGEDTESETEKKRSCRTVEILLKVFDPTMEEIVSKSPKSFFDELGCIDDFEKEIRSIRQQEETERASLKGVKLMKPSDIKKETYVSNGLFSSFVENCEKRVPILREEVKKKLDLVEEREHNFSIFNNAIRTYFFYDSREEYEEKLRVHIENPNSRIFRYIDSLYSNLPEEKTKNIQKGRRLVSVKLYEDGYSFNLDSDTDRRFISLLQNTAIKYIVKDVFFKHVEEKSREEDEFFLKCCNLLSEYMDHFGHFFIEANDGVFGIEDKFLLEKSVEKELSENHTFEDPIECIQRLDTTSSIYDPMEITIILCQTCCVLATVSRRVCFRNGESKWSFGADNFFPSLTYVMIRARIRKFCTQLNYAKLFFSSNYYLYQDWLTNKSELKYYLTVFDAVRDFVKQEGRKILDDETPILEFLVARRNMKKKEDTMFIKLLDDEERGLFLRNNLCRFEIRILGSGEKKGDGDFQQKILHCSLIFFPQ